MFFGALLGVLTYVALAVPAVKLTDWLFDLASLAALVVTICMQQVCCAQVRQRHWHLVSEYR